jgi:D-alanyl-D-alanine carboxypeptidase
MLRRSFAPFAFFAGLVALVVALPGHAAPAQVAEVVMDAATGEILHQANADQVSPPASVAKLMTFLIAHDVIAAGKARLDTPITTTQADKDMGGTQVHLDVGEITPVEELLYALMVESANDAAHALTALAGGREPFVAAMNARAQGLGMTRSSFRSPHGLPPSSRIVEDGDLTTARDLALLARELVTHTEVLRYSAVRTRPFGVGRRPEPLPMRNHNRLLGTVAGCDGLKTGFTRAAGYCLVATARRDQRRAIVVVLGAADARGRDARVAELFEQAFARIPASSVFEEAPVAVVPVAPVPLAPVAGATAAGGETKPTEGTSTTEEPPVRFVLPGR